MPIHRLDMTNGDDLDGCVPVRFHEVSFYYGLRRSLR